MCDFKNYKALQSSFLQTVSPIYAEREAGQIFYRILDHYLGWSHTDFHLNQAQKPDARLVDDLGVITDQLLAARPVQYILGVAHFYGLRLKVNPAVLIPRPETEGLAELVLSDRVMGCQSVIDIGTGSGALALAIQSQRPSWRVTAIDVSAPALAVARENAERNGIPLTFRLLDICVPAEWEALPHWDRIVSNPPYVQASEKSQMQPNVLDYEPHAALFPPAENPLLFYDVIADFAQQKLRSGGKLYFEINPCLTRETADLVCQKGFKTELHKDLSGRCRFLIAKRFD